MGCYVGYGKSENSSLLYKCRFGFSCMTERCWCWLFSMFWITGVDGVWDAFAMIQDDGRWHIWESWCHLHRQFLLYCFGLAHSSGSGPVFETRGVHLKTPIRLCTLHVLKYM